jgi:hypothetical protein
MARPPKAGDTPRPVMLIAASRAGAPWALAGVVTLIAAAALAPRSYHSPFSQWLEAQPFAPFAPALVALVLGFAFSNNMSVLERVTPPIRLRISRATWALIVLTIAACAAILLMPLVDPPWRIPLLRNMMSLTGLAILGAVILGARLAWVAVLPPVVAMLLVGRDPIDAHVQGWAVLLHPAGSVVSACLAAGLAAVALFSYVVWDTRPSHGIAGE